jgi:hypothetical protein
LSLKVEYTAFADRAILEQGSNKFSLIGIFYSVNGTMPIIPVMCLFCLFRGDPGHYSCKVRVRFSGEGSENIKGNFMPDMPLELNIGADNLTQGVLNFVGLPILGDKIEFSICQEDRIIHTVSLPVIKKGIKDNASTN